MVTLGSTIAIVISLFMLGFRFTANLSSWPSPTADVLTFAAVIVMLSGAAGVFLSMRHNNLF